MKCGEIKMSKYQKLWEYVQQNHPTELSFSEIGQIAGVPLDHSFLNYKKELNEYGYQVDKISLKHQVVRFSQLK